MIEILGSHGNRSEKFHTTCIRVSKHSVIDAGNIIYGLKDEAKEIDNIFLSHSHLDHILDCGFLCDNFFTSRKKPLKIYGLKKTLDSLKKHIFNWEIWPDFSKLELKNSKKSILEFIEIKPNENIKIDDVILSPIVVNHTIDCCGYIIKKDGKAILFSADTYTTDTIWDTINKDKSINTLIIDVSFPSNMDKLASHSKHLTPKLLQEEMKKLKREINTYIYHIKSNYHKIIEKELEKIGIDKKNILEGKECINFNGDKIENKTKLSEIEKVKMLNKIGLSLSIKDNLADILDMIVDEAIKMTGADGGSLYLVDTDKNMLDFTVLINKSLNTHLSKIKNQEQWISIPLYFKNGQKNQKMVVAVCALEDKLINIEDVYKIKDYDFSGTKIFDKKSGYRSQSMLVVPLRDHEKNVIGVLQLINKQNKDKIVAFDRDDEELILSLASQAAISIINTNLVNDLENLLESFLKSIVYAIERKSPYTANHIYKMVELSKMLAKEIDKDKGVFKNKKFNKDDLKKINFAALMHDVGKLSTPDYILDKSTKLDGLYDRVKEIKTRVWAIKKEFEVAFLKNEISKEVFDKNIDELNSALELIVNANKGSELLEEKKVKKIELLAKLPFKCAKKEFYLLNQEEANLLKIQKGTLSEKERETINEHAKISLEILNKLPFPKKYKDIPAIAGEHHEKLNGKGYPQGLSGDEISFESRILAIADIFEALTSSDRPYKKANSLSTAMKILYFMAKDGDLDKDLVKFFYESKLYKKFAEKSLKKEQIDEVEIDFSTL
jgi:HD-GYP domain-containing protein (c-di-GMP phosphodiesterase class II)/ribonuclease BN (tRNA processing enzyme)